MKKLILHNWKAKAIALLLAIAIWMLITNNNRITSQPLPQPGDFRFGGSLPTLESPAPK